MDQGRQAKDDRGSAISGTGAVVVLFVVGLLKTA
jgi:hypothetical protein